MCVEHAEHLKRQQMRKQKVCCAGAQQGNIG